MNSPHSDVAVRFQGLSVVFSRPRKEPLRAVDSLDLDIARGRILGLLGPNGSGKTTSINALCGLLRPTSGTVICEGIDVRHDVTGVRTLLGVVPQETSLYNDLTAEENLRFHARLYRVPRQEQRSRIDEVLDLVGLTSRRSDRAGTFSGGMQRRLALARALLTRPSVVVLDEPTLGVDVQSRASLWRHIRGVADSGGTVLLTTNYMEEAQALADELAIIDHGRLVAKGTPNEMRSQLGQSFIEIATTLPTGMRASAEALPGVGGAEWHDHRVVLAADGDPDTVSSVLEYFSTEDPGARLLTVRQPDLNDVFLELTGSALRDGAA